VNRPRVLLADDHCVVGEGLKRLLEDDFELVGMVEDGRALVAAAKKLQPDVIVADITMPHLNGIDAMAQLKKDNARVKVVFLTMHQNPPTRGGPWRREQPVLWSSTRPPLSSSWLFRQRSKGRHSSLPHWRAMFFGRASMDHERITT
jgi:CheY-like chemotaxis protein